MSTTSITFFGLFMTIYMTPIALNRSSYDSCRITAHAAQSMPLKRNPRTLTTVKRW